MPLPKACYKEAYLRSIGIDPSWTKEQLIETLDKALKRAKKLDEDLAVKTAWAEHEIEHYQHGKYQLVEQLKTWSFALNRLGIGLEIVAEWVRFTKGTLAITMTLDHVLEHGIHLIVDMMSRVRNSRSGLLRVDEACLFSEHLATVQALAAQTDEEIEAEWQTLA